LPRIKVAKSLPTGRAYTAEDVAKMIRQARHRRGRTGGKLSCWWWATLIYMAYCTGERAAALLSLGLAPAFAQPGPPARPAERPIVIDGGTVHTVSGARIENGRIAFHP
jgi:hypothetical protein